MMQFVYQFLHGNKLAILFSSLLKTRLIRKYAIDVAPTATLLGGLRIEHPVGIVIGYGVRIGQDCFIAQQVTLGLRNSDTDLETDYPTLGRNVFIGAGSIILGGVHIGDHATIGAGSMILRDVGSGQTIVGVHK